MSQFSQRLRIFIKESGKNVYQISRLSGLDRTTIQRAINGERLPNTDFVERLCDYLRVTPAERAELMELHTMARVGEKVYSGRLYIKNLIENLASIHVERNDAIFHGERRLSISRKNAKSHTPVFGLLSVNNLILEVLAYEVLSSATPTICLNIPFENAFLFDLLKQFFLSSDKNLQVNHIFQLSKNPLALKNSNYNLTILSHILPFAFSQFRGYQPFYYYGNVDAFRDPAFVLPHYILTSNFLIRISADFDTAILCDDPDIIAIYRASFDRCLHLSKPLLSPLGNCDDLLSTYLSVHKAAGQFTHSLEPQPCLA